jgi:acyl transferase domain-containing protein
MAIVCKRSAVLTGAEGPAGAMALTELSFEEAERWIGDYAGRIAIASSNSPCSTVLAGDSDALQELFAKLEQKKLFCRWVKAKGAGHSHHIEPF